MTTLGATACPPAFIDDDSGVFGWGPSVARVLCRARFRIAPRFKELRTPLYCSRANRLKSALMIASTYLSSCFLGSCRIRSCRYLRRL